MQYHFFFFSFWIERVLLTRISFVDFVKTKHQQHGGGEHVGIIKMLVDIGKKNPTMLWSGGKISS